MSDQTVWRQVFAVQPVLFTFSTALSSPSTRSPAHELLIIYFFKQTWLVSESCTHRRRDEDVAMVTFPKTGDNEVTLELKLKT